MKSRSADGLLVDDGPVKEYLHLDDDQLVVERLQDVEPILQNCKDNSNAPDAGKNKAGDWYHAGRFPLVIVEAWLTQRGLKMRDFRDSVLREFLNDSNHSAFRIWPGRV